MRTRNKFFGAAIAVAAVFLVAAFGHSRASADDARLTVRPAVQTVTDPGHSGANVQLVGWGRPYGYRYRGFYGPYYGGGYYTPYYAPYYAPAPYAYPSYGGYGITYSYPPSYGYGYPVYGYPAYGGVGIRAGGVGVGIW